MHFKPYLELVLKTTEQLQKPADDLKMHRCRWRGREFPCTLGSEQRSRELGVGGWVDQVSIPIYIRKSLVDPVIDASSTDVTADSDEITADSDQSDPRATKTIEVITLNRAYRIADVKLDPTGTFYALTCTDPYRP